AAPAEDLLVLTASLVAVPSVSRQEDVLADGVERRLAERASRLALTRVGNTVIARTELSRDRRIVLGGHLDTVPANGNEVPRLDGDVLHGLGSADMKGGLAVLLRVAEEISAGREPRFDCTLAFYEGEEIADEFNGLRHVFVERPDLLAGDFAVLLEPTGDHIEAGCQGTLHLRAHFDGERAHSARPWRGRNAIYAAADVLERLAAHEPDTVVVDGLPYRESLPAVRVPRHPGRELRARRPRRGPHRRRAGHPGVGRAVLRRLRPVPRPGRVSGGVRPCGERSPLSRRRGRHRGRRRARPSPRWRA